MNIIQLHPGSRVQRSGSILFSKLDDELLAIDGQAGNCYSLNESAGSAWELLREPITVAAVCAQLRREYSVDPATCEGDILELLQNLLAAGLIEVRQDG